MWIAEGFIRKQEGLSLEETAQNYVEDLINRHLVVVGQYSLDGKVKTCRVHEMLHDFCKIQATKENVLQEIKFKNGVFEPPISELPHYHRLCIHSCVLDFLQSKPHGPSVRSLVSFSSDEVNLPSVTISTIYAAFEAVRILDVKPSSDMYRLLHLRYLSLSCTLSVLPAHFSKLSNLQTLIVDTTSFTLEDKANILNFVQLRHFKTNATVSLPRVSNTRQEAENLQTLGLISPESCTEKNLGRAPNLKKLGIRGRLSLLMDGKEDSFECVGRLAYLEKLKLSNYAYPHSPLADPVRNLPPGYKFPPRLRSLTLSKTSLDWSQMHVLGSLEELKVLKLKDNAFVGDTWVTGDGGFRNLEGLHIKLTDLVIWVTSANHFPKLKHLELYNCNKLKEVPIELADILSLQRLKLFRVDLAVASAKRIHKRKHRKDIAFELSIFDPKAVGLPLH
ncbi:putative late blight resistance protein homolog R1A-3 [Salvia hispanica]|uniref:putative late blight resistance protein homolog R1A-3 n=1 Tax=Salvia hispanica TaxID=49212 RepID=UPI0020094D37|nr:putative late blight resistance protein homolog R1A-3 [Salvia hispanica]